MATGEDRKLDYETLLAEIVDPAPPALLRHLRAITNGGEKLTRKDVRMIAFGFLSGADKWRRSYRHAVLASMVEPKAGP